MSVARRPHFFLDGTLTRNVPQFFCGALLESGGHVIFCTSASNERRATMKWQGVFPAITT